MDTKKFIQDLKKTKTENKVLINIRVEPALRTALGEFCKKNGVTATQVMEKLLKDLLGVK